MLTKQSFTLFSHPYVDLLTCSVTITVSVSITCWETKRKEGFMPKLSPLSLFTIKTKTFKAKCRCVFFGSQFGKWEFWCKLLVKMQFVSVCTAYRSRYPPWHQDIPSLHHRILSQQIKNIMYRMQHGYGVPLVPKICFYVYIRRFFLKYVTWKRNKLQKQNKILHLDMFRFYFVDVFNSSVKCDPNFEVLFLFHITPFRK